MLKGLCLTTWFLVSAVRLPGMPITLRSPDKRISVFVDLRGRISYSVAVSGAPLLRDSYLQLNHLVCGRYER